jgi:hypothetical protein
LRGPSGPEQYKPRLHGRMYAHASVGPLRDIRFLFRGIRMHGLT